MLKKSEDIKKKNYKTSNNYTTLIQHSNRMGGASAQRTSFKVQRKKANKLLLKSSRFT